MSGDILGGAAPTPVASGLRARLREARARLSTEGRQRVRRLAPALLPRPAVAIAGLGWATICLLAAACLVAPWVLPLQPSGVRVWPGWFWFVVIAAAAAFAAAGSAAAAYLNRALYDSAATLVMAGLAAGAALIPAGAAAFAKVPGAATAWAIAATVLAGAVVGLVVARRRLPPLVVGAVAALAAGIWLAVPLLLGRPGFADYVAAHLAGLAGTVFFVTAVAGLSRTAQERHLRTRRWLGRPPSLRTLAVALLVVAALAGLRLTVAGDFFGKDPAELWQVRGWSSWPHAVLVAVLMLVLVRRSHDRPLRPDGQASVTWLYVAASSSLWLLFEVEAIALGARSAWTGAVAAPLELFSWGLEVGLVIVVVAGALMLRRRYAGSAGRTMAAVGSLYLVPPLLAMVLQDRAGWTLPTVWSTPVQVAIVLMVLVAGALLRAWFTGHDVVDPRAALRLLVVPALVLQGAWLIPRAIGSVAGPALVVIGVVAGLLWSMPPVAADPRRHARVVLVATAAAVATLALFLVTSASPYYASDLITMWAVLWLAVPVTTALAARVERHGTAARSGPSAVAHN